MKIINCPKDAYNYEFIVVTKEGDNLMFQKCFKNGFEAENYATSFFGQGNALIVHNVRIQGYKEPPKKKYYTFSGTWSWGCYAESKEEAIEKFNDEAYIEEFDISEYDKITEEDV